MYPHRLLFCMQKKAQMQANGPLPAMVWPNTKCVQGVHDWLCEHSNCVNSRPPGNWASSARTHARTHARTPAEPCHAPLWIHLQDQLEPRALNLRLRQISTLLRMHLADFFVRREYAEAAAVAD